MSGGGGRPWHCTSVFLVKYFKLWRSRGRLQSNVRFRKMPVKAVGRSHWNLGGLGLSALANWHLSSHFSVTSCKSPGAVILPWVSLPAT